MTSFEYVQNLLVNYESSVVDGRISPNDEMNNQWYFEIGKSAVENIALACLACKIQAVNRVLDIPCGHGRVLRHLVKLFPDAEYHACDLDADGVNFCASMFGARPIYSREELSEVNFGTRYDLIWVGSLFTHTSRDVTRRWITHLAKFLSPQGLVVATLHGRWCQQVHKLYPYISEDRWQDILKEYALSGYGYGDYTRKESHSYNSGRNGRNGISLVRPSVTIRDLEDISGIRIYHYRERGWADHQDVVVFGRPSYDEPW